MKQLITYILILLVTISCGSPEDMEKPDTGDVKLSFALDVPAARETMTRASYDDKSIRSIDLLQFGSNKKFVRRILVNNVVGSGVAHNFSVRLPASSEPTTFHIIANGRDANNADIVNFGEIAVGMDETVAIAKLETKVSKTVIAPTLPLIMSGKADLPNISMSTTVGLVSMFRSVASVYAACAVGDASNGINDFRLIGVSVQHTANKGRVIPNYSTTSPNELSVPSLPLSLSYINYLNPSGIIIWGEAANNITSELYMYERANVLDNTGLSVIVHGAYKNVAGYYKVWLKSSTNTALDVVRNHRYLVKIRSVSGVGYSTYQEALQATHPSNIVTQIVDNNDDIVDIIVDGKYELGLSANLVTVQGNGSKEIVTVLNTNATAEIKCSYSVPWIKNIQLVGAGDRRTMSATFDATTLSRKADIVVRAGHLSRTVTVTQNP